MNTSSTFLQSTKDFLISKNPDIINNSLTTNEVLSNYFSFSNLIDCFLVKDNTHNLSSVLAQDFITGNLTYFSNFSKSRLFTNVSESVSLNLDNKSLVSYMDFFKETDSFTIINNYLSDFNSLAVVKNNFDNLLNLYPQFYVELHTFEFLSYDEDGSLYADLSIPYKKFFYPEPFIASPSFVHEDLWFIHILHYQHWLWFMFISLIMFYFITFINVVRWCNPRNKPRRETRGVSRSKCADLITACVPVSWALSIIISESVDAADYYDGFGTGEIVIGIRAYQWGWEYFYPKGIDLNYNVNPSYSTLVGNSIKYNNTSLSHSDNNTFWKYYQNKSSNKVSTTPAHLLLTPSDNNKVLNFMNFDDAGLSTYKNSTAFKKIQYFSKTNPQLLYKTSSDLNNKFNRLNDLFLNESDILNSNNYKTLRQSSFSSNKTHLNNYSTVIDNSSLGKFLEYNFDTFNKSQDSWSNHNSKLFNRETVLQSSDLNVNPINDYLTTNRTYLDELSLFPTKSTYSSSETDLKSNSNSFKYLLNKGSTKKNPINSNFIYDLSSNNDFTIPSNVSFFSDELTNDSLSNRFKDLKSGDRSMLTSERNVRLLDNLNPSKFNPNYNVEENNLNNIVNTSLNSTLGTYESQSYNNSSLNWAAQNSLFRLLNNNLTVPSSQIPVPSNSPSFKPLEFDKFNSDSNELNSTLLQSKEESAPNYLFSNYWLTYWLSSNYSNLIKLNLNSFSKENNFYLPMFTKYAEYDFRNWQAIELLEDAFWESSFSAFAHEDYMNILQSVNEYTLFKKQEELFDLTTRTKGVLLSKNNKSLLKPFFKNNVHALNSNSLSLFSEDAFMNPSLLKNTSFKSIPDELSLDSLEDSYDNFKNNLRLNQLMYTNVTNINTLPVFPVSYSQVLDSFRADFEDSGISHDYSTLDLLEDESVNLSSSTRLLNPVKLRSTARNSIVTFNAIQKVFKSRFDEGRANARLQDLSNSYNSQPFLTEKRSSYEGLLAKNTENFFNVNFYNTKLNTSNSSLFSVWSSLNTYYIDLPFLVSNFSDSARHLWFDWQSRWSSLEVQPSSVARYSLSGVPYFNKSSEYSTNLGDELNDSENYLSRLARARKNYMSNWAYTPYLYSRSLDWYPLTSLNKILYSGDSLTDLRLSLKNSYSYWDSFIMSESLTNKYSVSSSGHSTPGRSSHKPLSPLSSYFYNNHILVDILSRREYVYRQFFASKNLVTNLPNFLTSSPQNPLINEVLSTYKFFDPINFSSETSRDYFFENHNFIKFTLMKDLLILFNTVIDKSSLNLNFINNYLFFYMFDNSSNSVNNTYLYKDQYRPMRKGITNMVRLHTTGAIAMPIEIRLHILASSKDVIHSWAIPSAGIKIDCVPGYSSHRVAIFLTSGIFWGQCMEICGRFHHWMPIVVYFMKRDLFFLWCTHFMHYSTVDNVFNMTDKQLSDSLRLISFDKYSWGNELN